MVEYSWGTGRRKKSIARVRIIEGTGKFVVNNKPMEIYFPSLKDQILVNTPFQLTNTIGKFDTFVNVNGGGVSGQAGAIRLGIARGLCKADSNLTERLRDVGFLTRDSRMSERKKYGKRGARASFQFSKR